MVLLTMTPALVAAVQRRQELQLDVEAEKSPEDPAISEPAVGKPIAHGQVLDISRSLLLHYQAQEDARFTSSYHLEHLLRGSKVYVAPPKAKAEPTSEYKELMARLSKEDEARNYARMISPAPRGSNPFAKFTAPKTAAAWDLQADDGGADDDVNFSEINQQLALIINVLVSIIACSVAVWLIMRHWSVHARLAMSMLCSLVVGIAEVAIYAGYVRKLGEAKAKEKSRGEEKTVTDTWVIEASSNKESEPQRVSGSHSHGARDDLSGGARRRKGGK